MDILLLGGTGVMGKAVCQLLNDRNDTVTITSRKKNISSSNNFYYVCVNAKDKCELAKVLNKKYDVIIDFLVYSTEEFAERYELLLAHTCQYIFISSARVYAQAEGKITECTPRLLDISLDAEYLATDEYALCKARSEDLLNSSGKHNYTIVRPSITYGRERLQLGVLEKENWLYRALHGRSIVFSDDIAPKYTAMTLGSDVAKGIVSLIGKEKAMGETFHITSEKSYRWSEILACYLKTLENVTGYTPNVVMTEKSLKLKYREGKYQVIYCRYFNRSFDNKKVKAFLDVDEFTEPQVGLSKCLQDFLKNPVFKDIDWGMEAWNDRVAHEYTPLSEIPTWRQRIKYLLRRYYLDFMIDVPKTLLRKKYR